MNDKLYQVFFKNDPLYKDNKDHKKSPGIINMKKSFYDEDAHKIIMIN
jgi:hypothetical protein